MSAADGNLEGLGALIVGHGTRDPLGRQRFLEVVEDVADRMKTVAVLPAYLELAQPTIAEAIESAVEQGVRRLTVMPLLLLAAGHAKRDIPLAIEAARDRHRDIEFRLARHLGCHRLLLQLSAFRLQEAVSPHAVVADRDTALVMVGRGSRDEEAIEEMRQFTRLRGQSTPAGCVETCFASMAKPTLDETLAQVAGTKYLRVVVQPHLLFPGELMSRIEGFVERYSRQNPRQQWVVTKTLGRHPWLAEAICDVCGIW